MNIAFFVTGHGRSGTKWLAKVLNRDPSVAVHHEPIQKDVRAYARIYNGTLEPMTYLWRRQEDMCLIWRRHRDRDYAEVNSYLRYFVPELQLVSGVPVVALIRDGRYVVRSMMALGVYQRPGYPPIPGQGETPFEKCCWYWADTYRRLYGLETFRLEDLTQDYSHFCLLCNLLGVQVSEEEWRTFASTPINVGVGLTTPPVWSEEEYKIFYNVAGDIQGAYYENSHL